MTKRKREDTSDLEILSENVPFKRCDCHYHKLCNYTDCYACYLRSFASSTKADFWNYEKNCCIPRDVTLSNNQKFWFICNLCFHDFESQASAITKGCWCPYCATSCGKLCADSACAECYQKSFASFVKAEFWNYNKNICTPRDVTRSSHQKFWFTCSLCFHDFNSQLNSITNDRWCPYCPTTRKKLCRDSACAACYSKSFASSEKRDFWNYDKNTCTPRDVTRSNHQKFWFTCNVCSHDFESAASHISAGQWCPYCPTTGKKLCNNMDCLLCEENSFANHPRAAFWDYETNSVTPRDVTCCSHILYAFICEKGHQFESALNNITCGGTWCSNCTYKTQTIVAEFLGEHFSVKMESTYNWCKNSKGNLCRYDVEVSEKNCLIEVDGPQHFVDMPRWHSVATTVQENDIFKMKAALLNNMRVIRISQVDVWDNLFPWKTLLLDAVNSTAIVTFIAKESNLYNCHRQNYAQS